MESAPAPVYFRATSTLLVSDCQPVHRKHHPGGAEPPLVGLFVNLLRVPFRILFPIILLICLIGTYSISLSRFDLLILLGSGVMGYGFRKLRYDLAPFVLALIIGPTLEESFRQSLMRSGGSFSISGGARWHCPFWPSPPFFSSGASCGVSGGIKIKKGDTIKMRLPFSPVS